MRIVSVSENKKLEQRIAITPEIAKKYLALGFEVSLPQEYGYHLGFKDSVYEDLGVKIIKDEKEIINSADIIVQLSLLDDEKISSVKKNQILIGILNPYSNKDKLNKLVENNINIFSF